MRQTQLRVVQSLTLGAGAAGGQGEAVAQTETLNGGGQSSREGTKRSILMFFCEQRKRFAEWQATFGGIIMSS